MITLSPTEQVIYDTMTKDEDRVWTVEDLARVAYAKKGRRPDNWYHSMTAIMRGLMVKSLLMDIQIVRVSRLGRGGKAEYTCERGLGDGVPT